LYIQRYGNIPLKIYLWTLGWEPLAQQHTESAIFLPETFLNSPRSRKAGLMPERTDNFAPGFGACHQLFISLNN